MPIDVSCPSCSRAFRVRDDAAGRQFRCGDCGTLVTVPTADDPLQADREPAPPAGPHVNDWADRDSTSPTQPHPPGAQNPYRGADLAVYPGVGLMITGSLSLLIGLGNAAFIPISLLADQGGNPPPPQEAIALMAIIAAFQVLIGAVVGGLVFAGGNSLRKCGSYGLAMTGAIVAIVSVIFGCPCTPLGCSGIGMALLNLPVGIWALVVLCNADVKAAFNQPTPNDPASR